jgi:hypothetical protein
MLVREATVPGAEIVPPQSESKEALVDDFNALEAFGRFLTIGPCLR